MKILFVIISLLFCTAANADDRASLSRVLSLDEVPGLTIDLNGKVVAGQSFKTILSDSLDYYHRKGNDGYSHDELAVDKNVKSGVVAYDLTRVSPESKGTLRIAFMDGKNIRHVVNCKSPIGKANPVISAFRIFSESTECIDLDIGVCDQLVALAGVKDIEEMTAINARCSKIDEALNDAKLNDLIKSTYYKNREALELYRPLYFDLKPTDKKPGHIVTKPDNDLQNPARRKAILDICQGLESSKGKASAANEAGPDKAVREH